ncbi:hypothetical protein D3C76_182140 [compost metagenome]
MIDEFQASKSCYFYRQKAPITAVAITALFRGGILPPSQTLPHTTTSPGCFKLEEEVYVLSEGTPVSFSDNAL